MAATATSPFGLLNSPISGVAQAAAQGFRAITEGIVQPTSIAIQKREKAAPKHLKNKQDYNVLEAHNEGEDTKAEDVKKFREQGNKAIGRGFMKIIMGVAIAAAVITFAPGAIAGVLAAFTPGWGIGAAVTSTTAAMFANLQTVGIASAVIGAGTALTKGGAGKDLSLGTGGWKRSFGLGDTADYVAAQRTLEKNNGSAEQAISDQTATEQAEKTARELKAKIDNGTAAAPFLQEPIQDAPTWDKLIVQLAHTQNMNDSTLLEAIPDDAFDVTRNWRGKPDYTLTLTSREDIKGVLEELQDRATDEGEQAGFYSFLGALASKANAPNAPSRLKDIAAVCNEYWEDVRKSEIPKHLKALNDAVTVATVDTDARDVALGSLAALGLFTGHGKGGTKLAKDMLEHDGPLRTALRDIINATAPSDFHVLDDLIAHAGPSGQPGYDLQRLKEAAQLEQSNEEARQVAVPLLKKLQQDIDDYATGVKSITSDIEDTLQNLETNGYLKNVSGVWEISTDSVMNRAIVQLWVQSGGSSPALTNMFGSAVNFVHPSLLGTSDQQAQLGVLQTWANSTMAAALTSFQKNTPTL